MPTSSRSASALVRAALIDVVLAVRQPLSEPTCAKPMVMFFFAPPAAAAEPLLLVEAEPELLLPHPVSATTAPTVRSPRARTRALFQFTLTPSWALHPAPPRRREGWWSKRPVLAPSSVIANSTLGNAIVRNGNVTIVTRCSRRCRGCPRSR